jgi:hypothetical protein
VLSHLVKLIADGKVAVDGPARLDSHYRPV